MNYADRWLLPDGVQDMLPEQANRIEAMRRQQIDLYRSWGYQLIMPPLLEYTDSLLIGLGKDVDLLTFKVVDQLTGRTMGIRADITPQSARIDAHSMNAQGVNRLCYAGHVLHTRPKFPLATRTPVQTGVELFGEPSTAADIEVISLLLAGLEASGLDSVSVDISHVGIYRGLMTAANIGDDKESQFFELLQNKAMTEIKAWVSANIQSADLASMFLALPNLAGDSAVLDEAATLFAAAPGEVQEALGMLRQVSEQISLRYPEAKLYFDLGEIRGYHYHTGIVFSAFAPGYGSSIANGGRYDHIGEVFGRARPATGFAIDLSALESLTAASDAEQSDAIYAPYSDADGYWQAIVELRQQGETVIAGFAGESEPDTKMCQRKLVNERGEFRVLPL